ncbi:GNAT family N-acetyltransferase [Salinibacterium sp. NG253]|uniref:GNAT family N-acetyltransferase n=1 Tax=Salinibacterium sp. NG253 TaxID=2792039 RepID=UPI0018CE3EE1|nr:GNAT family N-acetyltransferase [Salinibacterium sp. NG253]MBH0117912.1 GNAT family N-acetyltransferase [Salinibacterium sp. NG253]
MPQFRSLPVTDALAHELLTEYFSYRAETFPTPSGYVTTFPTPEQFTEPRGVFLVIETNPEPAAGPGRDAKPTVASEASAVDAQSQATALGCGGIRQLEPGRFEVKHLWVRPEGRGAGLGRQLLSELERRARAWGATELVLDTNESLAAAGGLYRSSGFEPCEPYNDNSNATTWYLKTLR